MKRELVKNSLGFDSGIELYQDKKMFNYSVDTIMLGNFITINKNIGRILDIGTNNGALSLFISQRKKDLEIDAIDIQKKAISLAKKNIKMNNKKNINVLHYDFNDFYKQHAKKQKPKYDSIVCNPPFYKVDSTIKRKGSDELYIATHEVKLNLEQIISGSAKIIKQKGFLTFVLPTERSIDAFVLLKKYNFEPKRVQYIYPRVDDKLNLVLIESRFQTGWGPHFLKNLYLHTEDRKDNKYRDEIIKLYTPKIWKDRHE